MLRCCLALAAVLAVMATHGCGYRWTSRLDGGPSRTVSLDTVGTSLFPPRPGLEYELSRRLKDEIATDRRLVLTESAADVRLRVTLVEFTEPILVEDLRTAEPAEIQLQAGAMVDASGADFANGRVRRRVSVSVSYTPGTGDSRRAGLDRLWRELAREILDVAADTEWAGTD
jgi:hypothetical protein